MILAMYMCVHTYCITFISSLQIESLPWKLVNIRSMFQKIESDFLQTLLKYYFLLSSHHERELGRGADNLRWQIKSLATCVQRRFQTVLTFPHTRWPIVEAKGTIVHDATSHLTKMVVWRNTCSFTLGRNPTSARNATIRPIRFPI